MNRKITIDPITRLEGHGKIDINLDENGDVASATFQVPELRGFESFSVGRMAEEMPNITNRICGVCPEAHHIAAIKAVEAAWDITPLPAAQRIRELIYMAFFVADHTTHFYCLGGPDFIVGPDAPPSERNILGVIRKVGIDVGKEVINCRKRNHELIKKLGGRGVHLCGALPGGWSVAISREMRDEFADYAEQNVEFAKFSLDIFKKVVLADPQFSEMIFSDLYRHETYSMGTVDSDNFLNLFDGKIRVVDTVGRELAKYRPFEYRNHVEERVENWTYMKFPYLKKIGWKGFVDGQDSGVYHATPLARMNVSDKISTPLANEEFEAIYDTFNARGKGDGGRNMPLHNRLATHWARLIELLHASEKMVEILKHPDICDTDVRKITEPKKGEGVGSVEAPRGTLIHHYKTDERGILTDVNMIVGTTNNNAAISLSIMKAAKGLIRGGKFSEGTLNRVEMAFRLYDPCCSCATHPFGKAPLQLNLYDSRKNLLDRVVRN